ncbi:defensin-like protein [Musa troglodytarum]|uniref:Defensin-like protein n=1 Tax=Musa troglodytarum TaxID=320322 RepID=A0A9E7KBN4_9LILI|nr:defensin-like protein [Musa troglodytarum]
MEAKICRLPSLGFRGPCTSDKNCAKVCQREGFDSGDCEGYTMGCLCNKHC